MLLSSLLWNIAQARFTMLPCEDYSGKKCPTGRECFVDRRGLCRTPCEDFVLACPGNRECFYKEDEGGWTCTTGIEELELQVYDSYYAPTDGLVSLRLCKLQKTDHPPTLQDPLEYTNCCDTHRFSVPDTQGTTFSVTRHVMGKCSRWDPSSGLLKVYVENHSGNACGFSSIQVYARGRPLIERDNSSAKSIWADDKTVYLFPPETEWLPWNNRAAAWNHVIGKTCAEYASQPPICGGKNKSYLYVPAWKRNIYCTNDCEQKCCLSESPILCHSTRELGSDCMWGEEDSEHSEYGIQTHCVGDRPCIIGTGAYGLCHNSRCLARCEDDWQCPETMTCVGKKCMQHTVPLRKPRTREVCSEDIMWQLSRTRSVRNGYVPWFAMSQDKVELEESFDLQGLIKYNKSDVSRCAGTLIATTYILTSAYCQAYFTAGSKVTLGKADAKDISYFVQKHAVKRIIPHAAFRPDTGINDIMLVELETPANITYAVTPACLPTTPVRKGREVMLSGFGLRFPWSKVETLTTMDLAVEPCIKKRNKRLGGFCAARTWQSDTCLVTNGGPLASQRASSKTAELVGIVPAGVGCGELGAPAHYTAVFEYLGWIQENSGLSSCPRGGHACPAQNACVTRCNGVVECADGSDENLCTCEEAVIGSCPAWCSGRGWCRTIPFLPMAYGFCRFTSSSGTILDSRKQVVAYDTRRTIGQCSFWCQGRSECKAFAFGLLSEKKIGFCVLYRYGTAIGIIGGGDIPVSAYSSFQVLVPSVSCFRVDKSWQ